MLPSSSSQLARYGQVNHYKKFWLLQTQLEKQEQSASSSLSLGNTNNMSASVANNVAVSPLVAMSGDHHLVGTIAASPYGTCRADTQAASGTNCSGRVNSVSTFSYCPVNHEPACSSSSYLLHMPEYSADVLRGHDGPRLSLAVNCGNVSDSHEYESCESSEVEKQVCNRTASQVQSTSSLQLRFHDQLHGITEFQSRNLINLSHMNSHPSTPQSSNGNLRTCSLCGTTKTPLWRSGPDGPKSLCNACGIRVKKTKKLEAAMQATSGSSPSPSPSPTSVYKGALKRKLMSESRKDATFHKKKRSTSMHMSPTIGKQGLSCNGGIWDIGSPKVAQGLPGESGRRCGNMLAKDVEEAAVLLMALSCGLVLS